MYCILRCKDTVSFLKNVHLYLFFYKRLTNNENFANKAHIIINKLPIIVSNFVKLMITLNAF